MPWRRKSTSVDIDVEASLDEFSEDQLLQGLIDSGWISDTEAEAISNRASRNDKASSVLRDKTFDPDLLDDAMRAARSGDKKEALHYIEHYLGRDWIGVLQ